MAFNIARNGPPIFLVVTASALGMLSCRPAQSSNGGALPGIALPPAWTPTLPAPANATSPPPASMASPIALPAAWPFPTPSSDQIARARECQSVYLQSELYPPYELQATPTSQPGTDDACSAANAAYIMALQAAEQDPLSEDLPAAGIEAFERTVQENPAFLFHEDLFYAYFGVIPLVEAPPVSAQSISEATIHYTWWGLGGDELEYNVTVTQGDSTPRVEVTTIHGPRIPSAAPSLGVETIQALAPALTDLIPAPGGLAILRCTDNNPDWDLRLHFADGSIVTATTNGSNFFPFGGPWQVEISGQPYVQISSALAKAVYELVTQMQLPLGQPAAMSCFPVPVFDQVYGE